MTKTQKQGVLSTAHILRMTMLSQRTVDYSIKAYSLNNSELCGLACLAQRDLRRLQRCIGRRGRNLLAEGVSVDSRSHAASCSLRIYAALHVMFTAATEIAQNTMCIMQRGRKIPSPQVVEAGQFINSQIRLCSVALLKKEVSHARTVLRMEKGRGVSDHAMYRELRNLSRHPGAHNSCERAIASCLIQIAEQSCELAEAIILWLDGKDCANPAEARAA